MENKNIELFKEYLNEYEERMHEIVNKKDD